MANSSRLGWGGRRGAVWSSQLPARSRVAASEDGLPDRPSLTSASKIERHSLQDSAGQIYDHKRMGRPKGFKREEVLTKAISVFWEKGFAEATLQDLERITGVNKSGLYTEFKDKQDIFLASLKHYLSTRGGDDLLAARPRGWKNIQRFLEVGQTCYTGRRGCFSINSMRDVAMMPADAQQIIAENNKVLKKLIVSNIRAASPGANASMLADLVLTFFAGLCIEQNLNPADSVTARKIDNFMRFLRGSE